MSGIGRQGRCDSFAPKHASHVDVDVEHDDERDDDLEDAVQETHEETEVLARPQLH